jgi:hypothetical protein
MPVAFLAIASASLRLFSAKSVKATCGVLGLGFIAACLLINSRTIYLALDPLLGGTNGLYLTVQLTWVLAMFFMKVAFVPDKHANDERRRFSLLDVWILLAFIALITAFFLLSSMPETAYRVAPYRTEWTAIAFTQLVNIYSAGCAFLIVKNCLTVIKVTPRPRMRRMGFGAVCAGFALGLVAFTERIAFAPFSIGASGETRTQLETIDGGIVALCTTLIVVGFLFLAIGNGQQRSKQDTDTFRTAQNSEPLSNVTPIREANRPSR